ncbi:CLAVATA3/ESR (CLE)-related protein 46-like [Corylus avellana]|uniref:CLAVATA3/ESR (CLE)-related protein 46-like n=1 Tax=Corylus avellana TaxID=13451 RepID=UPI001E236144|nr:CLAVATA3/ESR (CLE)-related protein 46-like [Corylus avellana]
MHQQLMRRMRRHTIIHLLLLACLLLAASQQPYFSVNVQALEPAHFRLRSGHTSLRSHNRNALPSWVEEKKIHKSPSGPNPVGNHRPPSRL